MKGSTRLGVATAMLVIVSACNYTDGVCWRRDQGGIDGPGGVGGSVGGPGAGGYGDFGNNGDAPPSEGTGANACNAPEEEPEPPDEGGQPADTWIDCKKLNLGPMDCMRKCAEVGMSCAAALSHPYKADGGVGGLFNCKNGYPTNTCSYKHPNGDTCIFFAVLKYRAPVCVYTGGK